MHQLDLNDIVKYVEDHIDTFHHKRLISLDRLKLANILKRKNPYLFKAKNILTAHDLVKTLLDAHLSSQEETIFGDFLEGLAIYINTKVYRGHKSAAEGIDLEFDHKEIKYIVSIKSGPNWGNSSQIKRMIDNFKKAKKILRANNTLMNIIAINGCCYGRELKSDKGDYQKLCGQEFWTFISGKDTLYTDIIEPLGYQAKQKNEAFVEEYSRILNNFTVEFSTKFCFDGKIDWETLVKFNSAK